VGAFVNGKKYHDLPVHKCTEKDKKDFFPANAMMAKRMNDEWQEQYCLDWEDENLQLFGT